MKSRWLILIGASLIILGLGALLVSYAPLAYQEFNYWWRQQSLAQSTNQFSTDSPTPTPIVPIDPDFGIVIPKIGANAPVVATVDPYDPAVYQRALTKGVAHAKGSGLPDDNQTMFLFAHASGDILMAQRYNSVFYLLNKLEPEDEVTIYYQGEPITYTVTATKTVSPDAVDYLTNDPNTDLILMTCTPPGTTWKRLLVMAERTPL